MPTPHSDSKPKSRVRREMKNSWLELEAEDGSVYYANLVTKQTSWEAPPDAHLQTATAVAAEQKRSTPPGRSSSSWHMDWPEISETAPAAPAAPSAADAAAPVGHSDEEERWSWLDGRSDASSFDGEQSVGEDGDRGNLEDRRRPNSASFSSSFSSSTTARGSKFEDYSRGGDIDGPVLETVGDWVRTIDPSSKRCYWANPVTGESSWKSPQQRNEPARRQQQLASLSQDPFAPTPTTTVDAARPRARDSGRVPFSDRSSAENEGYRSSVGGRGIDRGGRKREEEEIEGLEREVRRLRKEAASAAGRIREAIIRADQADADASRLREEIACLERESEADRVRFSDVVRRGSEVSTELDSERERADAAMEKVRRLGEELGRCVEREGLLQDRAARAESRARAAAEGWEEDKELWEADRRSWQRQVSEMESRLSDVNAGREAAIKEKDAALREVSSLRGERDAALREVSSLRGERDAALRDKEEAVCGLGEERKRIEGAERRGEERGKREEQERWRESWERERVELVGRLEASEAAMEQEVRSLLERMERERAEWGREREALVADSVERAEEWQVREGRLVQELKRRALEGGREEAMRYFDKEHLEVWSSDVGKNKNAAYVDGDAATKIFEGVHIAAPGKGDKNSDFSRPSTAATAGYGSGNDDKNNTSGAFDRISGSSLHASNSSSRSSRSDRSSASDRSRISTQYFEGRIADERVQQGAQGASEEAQGRLWSGRSGARASQPSTEPLINRGVSPPHTCSSTSQSSLQHQHQPQHQRYSMSATGPACHQTFSTNPPDDDGGHNLLPQEIPPPPSAPNPHRMSRLSNPGIRSVTGGVDESGPSDGRTAYKSQNSDDQHHQALPQARGAPLVLKTTAAKNIMNSEGGFVNNNNIISSNNSGISNNNSSNTSSNVGCDCSLAIQQLAESHTLESARTASRSLSMLTMDPPGRSTVVSHPFGIHTLAAAVSCRWQGDAAIVRCCSLAIANCALDKAGRGAIMSCRGSEGLAAISLILATNDPEALRYACLGCSAIASDHQWRSALLQGGSEARGLLEGVVGALSSGDTQSVRYAAATMRHLSSEGGGGKWFPEGAREGLARLVDCADSSTARYAQAALRSISECAI